MIVSRTVQNSHEALIAQLDEISAVKPSSDEESLVTINGKGDQGTLREVQKSEGSLSGSINIQVIDLDIATWPS